MPCGKVGHGCIQHIGNEIPMHTSEVEFLLQRSSKIRKCMRVNHKYLHYTFCVTATNEGNKFSLENKYIILAKNVINRVKKK